MLYLADDPTSLLLCLKKSEKWKGTIRDPSASWKEVRPAIERKPYTLADNASNGKSPYKDRFVNGANAYPRVLTTVIPNDVPPLGVGAGRRAIRSADRIHGNEPWKSMPAQKGVVEAQFIHPMLIGYSVLPYRQQTPAEAVLPLRSGTMMSDDEIRDYEGLKNWWEKAEGLWKDIKKLGTDENPDGLTLKESINDFNKLTNQFPLDPLRVAYARSGGYLTACRVATPTAIIENQLNWTSVRSLKEARYLCSVLNSAYLTTAIKPYMVSGLYGQRHITSSVWNQPIPLYDNSNKLHRTLAKLGAQAEEYVADLEIKPLKIVGPMRNRVRKALAASDLGRSIEEAVTELLD